MATMSDTLSTLFGDSYAPVVKFAEELATMSNEDFDKLLSVSDDDTEFISINQQNQNFLVNLQKMFSENNGVNDLFAEKTVADVLQRSASTNILKSDEIKNAYKAAVEAWTASASPTQVSMCMSLIDTAIASRAGNIDRAINPLKNLTENATSFTSLAQDNVKSHVARVIAIGLATSHIANDNVVESYSPEQCQLLYKRYADFMSEQK